MGAARWRCPRYCSERSAWLDRYVRNLLTPARCAELPLAAREAGQHWPRRRSFPLLNAPLAGSDGAEARHAASGRSGGFAQSCGWCWSFDRGRSDPRSRHPQGSCGRFARVLSAMLVSGCLRPRPFHSGQGNSSCNRFRANRIAHNLKAKYPRSFGGRLFPLLSSRRVKASHQYRAAHRRSRVRAPLAGLSFFPFLFAAGRGLSRCGHQHASRRDRHAASPRFLLLPGAAAAGCWGGEL